MQSLPSSLFSSSPLSRLSFPSHLAPGLVSAPRGNTQDVPRLRLCLLLLSITTLLPEILLPRHFAWALTSCLSSCELPASLRNLTTASLWCVRAPRLCFMKLPYLIIPGLSGLVLNLLTQTPKSQPHLHHHCSLSGQCGYSAEGWKIVEGSGDMGGEVGSVCIFKRSMEAEANHSLRRQPVEGFLGEGGN